jgi:hypothetical protein
MRRRQLARDARSSAPRSDDDDDDEDDYEEWVALPNGSFQFASAGASERQPSSLSSPGSAGSGALAAYARMWAVYVCVPAVDAALLGAQGAVDSRPLGYVDLVLLPAAVLAAAATPHRIAALAASRARFGRGAAIAAVATTTQVPLVVNIMVDAAQHALLRAGYLPTHRTPLNAS